jgi:hypothetical protein
MTLHTRLNCMVPGIAPQQDMHCAPAARLILPLPLQAWKEAWQEARDARRPWKGMLYGNDIHPGALSLAMRDMKRAELQPISRLHAGERLWCKQAPLAREWECPGQWQLVLAAHRLRGVLSAVADGVLVVECNAYTADPIQISECRYIMLSQKSSEVAGISTTSSNIGNTVMLCGGCVCWCAGDCRTWELPEAPSLVAVNPPWGRRIGQGQGGGPPSNRGGRCNM